MSLIFDMKTKTRSEICENGLHKVDEGQNLSTAPGNVLHKVDEGQNSSKAPGKRPS
ncbi:hypothetical protein [Bacillus salipaludis]|uniref:hypothetical protein n=1 Tax=Bacillus salipaludis TaxID=2547811 RepID=UPI002E1CAA0B|nr:hypothetical protein [Bacillus salipaludis]